MVSISLCMIVKNEEDVLRRCLASITDIVDEIIIVDTGSTDSTKEIAKSFKAQVYDFKWIYDFSAVRNFSFSHATKDYIMWLDADDVIMEVDRMKLKKLKEELDGSIGQIAALYNVAHDESGKVTLFYYRERLLKRSLNFRWEGEVHESIAFVEAVIYSDFAVSHFKQRPNEKCRNLKIYENILLKRKLCPREQYYYARELFYNDFIEKAVQEFLGFLETDGLIKNKVDASLLLNRCFLRLHNK